MFRFQAVIVILDTLFFTTSFAIHCNTNLPEGSEIKLNPAGRYLIEISGHPYSYTPNQKYTVTLRATNDADENKFVNFVLLVENKDPRHGETGYGSITLLGDALTKYKCSNAVMETNSIPKSEIQVLWVAPPPDHGCVVFKATIFVTREIWFSEDGPLSLTLCENTEDIDNIEPPILETCCACHEAKYEVTFESLWSRNTHPKDFPPNNFVTKFSDIIGATHSVDYKFWGYNEYASEGLKQLAQEGNTKMLETELKDKSNYIRTIIKARGISYPNITGKTFAVFRVDDRHHLMSLVSMIHPSPDWIVGVSSLELCQPNCSWVESKTLNLYPWDAGTDNGTTYLSEDSPTIPAAPITRITSKSSKESPFYDETDSNMMKPLARLILSRQRLYEKHNCEGPDSKELPDLEEYCAVTEWQEWSPCNVDCGRGTRHRQRTYKLKVVDQHKQRETCKKTLTQRSSCYGVKPECPVDGPPVEECELTPWGKWSECSVTCGNGTKTRSRRYRTRAAAKHCQQVTNNPPKLEQNFPCSLPPCDEADSIPPECVDRAWSEWSTCSVTCGKGTKMRRKLTINVSDLNRHNRISRSFDEESEEDFFGETGDECENVIERVECYNDEAPSCDETTTIPALACGLAVDVGLCRSNVDRWHFNSIKGKCELFSYSGCEGNKNNFRTLEMCEHVCGNYQKEEAVNRTKPRNSGGGTSGSRSFVTHQLQNDEPRQHYHSDYTFVGDTNDCVVSKWSHWSACSVTCGRGFKTKTRRILQPPGDGGKPCPEKLKKKKKCKLGSCAQEGDQDCIMSEWSPWSPCNYTCGPNAVRQRTRNIVQQPTGNGRPCESRVEIIKCLLTVCPDF